MNSKNNQLPARRREPMTDTQLLLTITICIFFVMYVAAILIWGGGFKKPQMLFDMLNDNAFLIIISCGLTIVMITGSISGISPTAMVMPNINDSSQLFLVSKLATKITGIITSINLISSFDMESMFWSKVLLVLSEDSDLAMEPK